MFDYNQQIKAFQAEKVRLPNEMSDMLIRHREANANRLISRLPDLCPSISIGLSNFRPQGSLAIRLTIQTKFVVEEYDVDFGLVVLRDQLVEDDGSYMTADKVRKLVQKALQDNRFTHQPEIMDNCVRVYYAEEDEYRHHIDFPIYRQYDKNGKFIRELAGAEGWVESNPTQVTVWFENKISTLQELLEGAGSQLRRMIRLLKRFCRSRYSWDMPNGMKLMMLAVECFQATERDDEAFYWLLVRLRNRLVANLEIENLADTNVPHKKLTKTSADANVVFLRTQINEALNKLSAVNSVACTRRDAREVWDWLFQSEGYFGEYDANADSEARKADLRAKAELINSARAYTSPSGVISVLGGIANRPHVFHGGTVGLASRMSRKGKISSQEQAIFSLQALRIRKYFPTFKCLSRMNVLKCLGIIRPTEHSSNYLIEIDYPMGGRPYVTIKEPQIVAKAKSHVYKEGYLCLYDPQKTPWRGTHNVHETIIPWIAEWLVFYELFLLEGKWGGPESSH